MHLGKENSWVLLMTLLDYYKLMRFLCVVFSDPSVITYSILFFVNKVRITYRERKRNRDRIINSPDYQIKDGMIVK